MGQVASALRAGYLAQQVRYYQLSVWASDAREVMDGFDNVLRLLARALAGLSGRMSPHQDTSAREMLEHIRDWYEAVNSCQNFFFENPPPVPDLPPEEFFQRTIRADRCSEAANMRVMQEAAWNDLRTLLTAIVGKDGRSAAWYEIGDHLADVIFQLSDNRIVPALSVDHWDYIYSGVDKLSSRERREVNRFFPSGYNDAADLGRQLLRTYKRLYRALDTDEQCWVAVPKWDGLKLEFRGRVKFVRAQSNSVIPCLLEVFERHNWPDQIPVPPDAKGDVKQAVSKFSENSPVRISKRKHHLTWTPQV